MNKKIPLGNCSERIYECSYCEKSLCKKCKIHCYACKLLLCGSCIKTTFTGLSVCRNHVFNKNPTAINSTGIPINFKLWGEILSMMPQPAPSLDEMPIKIGEWRGLSIILVDGDSVRLDADYFFRGGHDLVYRKLIPSKTVWIDGREPEDYWPFVLYHELVERTLMLIGFDYDGAHKIAENSEPDDF